MLDLLYERLSLTSKAPIVIIALAAMLTAGYLMTRLTRPAKLPDVTGYILAGIIIGPYLLDLVPDCVLHGTEFLPDIALAFIAFSSGRFFRLSVLRKNGAKVIIVTLAESLTASALVFCAMFFLLRLSLPFSLVLAALAAATAPASTMMTIRQTGAMGDFVDTLLQVVALDDNEKNKKLKITCGHIINHEDTYRFIIDDMYFHLPTDEDNIANDASYENK